MIYTVTLNPALDYALWCDKYIEGITNRAYAREITFGGKGIKVSLALKKLNIKSIPFIFIGGFTGDEFARLVAKDGIDAEYIRLQSGNTRINVKIKTGVESEINWQGPDIDKNALNELFEKLKQIKKDDTLVLSGSVPQSLPTDIYKTMIEKTNCRIVVDTTKQSLLPTLQYHPFLIKPNKQELDEIFGCDTDGQLPLYTKKLQDMGAKNILVSLGGDGAFLLDENGKTYTKKAPKGILKNSVGAGDATVAGFICEYDRSGDYARCIDFAVETGSKSAFGLL